jgi:2-iminobutanoate/2-iminopropanoate deaminase
VSLGPTLTTARAPGCRAPYPHARVDCDPVSVTGQMGSDPAIGDVVPGGFEREFRHVIASLATILEQSGSSLDRGLHTWVQFVVDADLEATNRIYRERFVEPWPARTSFGVAFLGKGAQVQIDAVAKHA